jgi:hypothetical protein
VATSKRMRRIQGEQVPPLKLSELKSRERLEVLNVRVRDLKPLLRFMPVQKLAEMRIIDRPSEHTSHYDEGLLWDTKALVVYRLLSVTRADLPSRPISGHWLVLTIEGAWVYWDGEGSGSDELGYKTHSSFSLVPQRELLDLVQGGPGVRIIREVTRNLLKYAGNTVRSHEQRAEETRRLFEGARVLTRDVVDLQA